MSLPQESTPMWYIVHTYTGYENKVAANLEKIVENRGLEKLILEVSVPVEKVTETTEKGEKEIERKLFPSYVLVKMVMNDETWHIVRNTTGVTGFVGPASEPTPLSEEEVKALGVEINSVQVNFEVGDQVQVNGTAMDGFIGIVQKINIEDGTVDVLVSMFGRDTQATLALNQVRRLDD